MAKTTSWTGAVGGDLSTAGNWDNGMFANGDTVYLNASSVDIVSSLDQSAIDVALFVIGPGYTGTLGNGTGDPAKFGAAKLVIAGGGPNAYIDTGASNFDDVFVTKVGTGLQNLAIMGNIGNLFIHKGTVNLFSGTTTALYVDAESETDANAVVTLSTPTVTTLYQLHGTITMSGAGTITTANFDGGTLGIAAGTLTTLNQRGGTCTWSTTNAITTATIYDGTFDASADARAKTITNLIAHAGAVLDLDNSAGNITLTNDLINYGAAVTWPIGSTVAYS